MARMNGVRGGAVVALATAYLLLGGGARALSAQEVDWGRDGWWLGAFSGQLNDEPEFSPEGRSDQFLNDAVYGGRAGFVFPFNLFLGGEAAVSFPEVQPNDRGPRTTSTVFLVGGDVGYNLQPSRRLQIFVAGGGEAVLWNPDGFDSETDLGFRYGTGARYFVTPQVAIRADVRWHHVRNALRDTRATALGTSTVSEEDLWGLELSGGVSLFFGGPTDSDGDGVYDDRDACPDTPSRVGVDERGCPVDGDGDGVPDGLDHCPGTTRGAHVDGEGCPRDSDQDRILDGLDECPDTPRRATVDDRGCPSDSDTDGILDGLDACPDTPEGATVDEDGCPTGALGILLRDFVSELNRLTVWFDFGRAELWGDSRPALDLLGKSLVQNPGLVVEIQGHADAIGPEEFNLRLSRRRAEAVRDYLAQEFPGIEPGQLVVRAYGEADPAAPNETAPGRQKNRRAMVVVVEPQP